VGESEIVRDGSPSHELGRRERGKRATCIRDGGSSRNEFVQLWSRFEVIDDLILGARGCLATPIALLVAIDP
jgi:hypothetical protein